MMMKRIDKSNTVGWISGLLMFFASVPVWALSSTDGDVLKSWTLTKDDHAGWVVVGSAYQAEGALRENARWTFGDEAACVGWGIGSDTDDQAFVNPKVSWLISPEIDLTQFRNRSLGVSFESACRFPGAAISIYYKLGDEISADTLGWIPVSGSPDLSLNNSGEYETDADGDRFYTASSFTRIADAAALANASRVRLAFRYTGASYSSSRLAASDRSPAVKEWSLRNVELRDGASGAKYVAAPTDVNVEYDEEKNELYVKWEHDGNGDPAYEFRIYYEYTLGNDWTGEFSIAQGRLTGSWESVLEEMKKSEYVTIDGFSTELIDGTPITVRERLRPSTHYYRVAVQARLKYPDPGSLSDKSYFPVDIFTQAKTVQISGKTRYRESIHGMYDLEILPEGELTVPPGTLAVFNRVRIIGDGSSWGGLVSNSHYEVGMEGDQSKILFRPGLRVIKDIRAESRIPYDRWSFVGLPFTTDSVRVGGRDAVLDENVRILYYDEVQRGRGISGFVNMASGGSSRPKLLASKGYTVKVARSLYPNASSVLPVVFYAPEKSEEIFNYSPYPRLVNGSIKYDYLSRKVSLTSTHCSDADYTRELELRDYDRGWNLIGSTFGSDSRFSTPNGELGDAGEMPRYAYVDDAEADGYRYVRRGEATIGSFQSIFLQIPTNRELYFNGASRVTVLNAPALYVSDTSIPSIHLSATDGARSDRFTIEFDPDGSDSYQAGYDLGKMLNGSGFNFYSLKGISPCAVQNVPLPDDGISIPVCLTTLRAGVHALSLEENTLGERYRVSLIDPSGVSSDLIASNDSIRFEAPASGEYRFLLQVRPRLDTSLSRPVTGLRANLSRSGSLLSVSVAEEAARLRVYTVSGDLVASADLAPSAEATLSVPAAGILIVTVHTASASETYKLIP